VGEGIDAVDGSHRIPQNVNSSGEAIDLCEAPLDDSREPRFPRDWTVPSVRFVTAVALGSAPAVAQRQPLYPRRVRRRGRRRRHNSRRPNVGRTGGGSACSQVWNQ